MPMRLPLKVSISPKAMSTEWWISASGGQQKPAMSIMHPKMHNAIAALICKRLIALLRVSVPLLTEDVLIEGLVLRLYSLVCRLVCHDLAWVFHTCASAC